MKCLSCKEQEIPQGGDICDECFERQKLQNRCLVCDSVVSGAACMNPDCKRNDFEFRGVVVTRKI